MAGSGVVSVYENGAITETAPTNPLIREGRSRPDALRRRYHGRRNANQARIAEEAGACGVMTLERVPTDIRAQGGVARMSDPQLIKKIKQAVTIPVTAKARIGHFQWF